MAVTRGRGRKATRRTKAARVGNQERPVTVARPAPVENTSETTRGGPGQGPPRTRFDWRNGWSKTTMLQAGAASAEQQVENHDQQNEIDDAAAIVADTGAHVVT